MTKRPLLMFLLGVLVGVLLCILGTRRSTTLTRREAACVLDYAESANTAPALAAIERLCRAAVE